MWTDPAPYRSEPSLQSGREHRWPPAYRAGLAAALVLILQLACSPHPTAAPAGAVSTPTGPVAVPIRHSGKASRAGADPASKDAPVALELFMMSQCPFARELLLELLPAMAELGPLATLSVDYIGRQDDADVLSSMHGEDEVTGDLAQICVAHQAPDRLPRFLLCQAKDSTMAVARSWPACAVEADVELRELQRCMDRGEGQRLLAASFARASERGARGSPTLFIDGERYEGPRTTRALMRRSCVHLRPSSKTCRALGQAPLVQVTIISDQRCTDCSDSLERTMRQKLSNPSIRRLDWSEPEAKRLMAAAGATKVPVALFGDSLDDDPDAAASLNRFLRGSPPLRYVEFGARWRPQCHDPGGCQRSECQADVVCRPEIPGRVDLLMMSYCPYANQALQTLQLLKTDFGAGLDLHVHHIVRGDARGGFKSMHGFREVEEDIRQACAAKIGRRTRADLRYLWCRAPTIVSTKGPQRENWQACTGAATGIAAAPLERCASALEGLQLLEQSSKLASDLGVGASPTFLVNNRYLHSNTSRARFEHFYCSHNPALPRCKLLAPLNEK